MEPTQDVERWLPVVGWGDRYEVSDRGRIQSLARTTYYLRGGRTVPRTVRQAVLDPWVDADGYQRTCFRSPGGQGKYYVHRLVLEAFVSPAAPGLQGCHYDGNPQNNRVENLRWDTPAANSQDAIRHGTNHNANKTHCKYGHEYTLENTFAQAGTNSRYCLTCRRTRDRTAELAKAKAMRAQNREARASQE